MPELGRYAVHVLSAYGVALLLLGGLLWRSVSRWRRLRDEARRTEGHRG